VILGGTIIHLSTEAEFLVVTSSNGFYSSAPFIKSGLKQFYNVNIVYGNLKSEISQDFSHKPQRNEIVRSRIRPQVDQSALSFERKGQKRHFQLFDHNLKYLG
jgi:hypothetical protein